MTLTASNSTSSTSITSRNVSSSTSSTELSESSSSTTSQTSSTTSAEASSTPSLAGPWTLSLFSEQGCKGDEYNFTQRSDGDHSYCVSHPNQLQTDQGNVGCTYGSRDGPKAGCDGGTWPFQPKSWYLGNGYCSIWRDTSCLRQVKGGVNYDNHVGCSNAPGDLSMVQSVSCSPRTPSCEACVKCRVYCLELQGQEDVFNK